MLDINGITEIIGDTFFGGDTVVAGMLLFAITLMIVLAVTKKVMYAMIVSIPLCVMFKGMNLVSNEMMTIVLIVAVAGLAMMVRTSWRS